jgi:hypothetical protein
MLADLLLPLRVATACNLPVLSLMTTMFQSRGRSSMRNWPRPISFAVYAVRSCLIVSIKRKSRRWM